MENPPAGNGQLTIDNGQLTMIENPPRKRHSERSAKGTKSKNLRTFDMFMQIVRAKIFRLRRKAASLKMTQIRRAESKQSTVNSSFCKGDCHASLRTGSQ